MDTLSLIQEFCPRTELQQKSKSHILKELNQYGSKLYHRDMLHAHMSASAIILNPSLDKTLMIYHNIYQAYTWTGGHADGQQNLFLTALNEAQEETGVQKIYPVTRSLLSVEILPVQAHIKNGKKVPYHCHYNVTFGFICPENQELIVKPDENSAIKWVDIAALPQICTEKEMIPIYEDNIRYIHALMEKKDEYYHLLSDKLLPWYQERARDLPWRKNKDPYRIWLSEIMLQQTRVDTVIDYYNRFLDVFPTVKALAHADEEKVLKLWEGLGYYSRARNLQKAAQIIAGQYGGVFPESPAELAKLPGIGAYTAGAVSSICFNQPAAAVDGNVLRVISRITEDYRCIDDDTTKKEISKNLERVYPKDYCGDFTQSLMELGATVCLPVAEPLCHLCPMATICMANTNASYSFLPVRKEKKSRKVQELTVFVFKCQGETALRRRNKKGVLYNMWELPNVEGRLSRKEAEQWLHNQKISKYIIEECVEDKHIFTHIQWQMQCYYISCEEIFGDYFWADSSILENEITLPAAFKKLLNRADTEYSLIQLEL